jgi:hypothetical protein
MPERPTAQKAASIWALLSLPSANPERTGCGDCASPKRLVQARRTVVANGGRREHPRANGCERKREHGCTIFAPDAQQHIVLIDLSVQSIMGAMDNLLILLMILWRNRPYVGLDGFILYFKRLEALVCNRVASRRDLRQAVRPSTRSHVNTGDRRRLPISFTLYSSA